MRASSYLNIHDPDCLPGETRSIGLHVKVAELAIGRRLPHGAVVHHVNEDILDNRPSNLVICQDTGYHHLLHARMRVVRAGGHPDTHKICSRCKGLKVRSDFYLCKSNPDGLNKTCRDCVKEYTAERAQRRKVTPTRTSAHKLTPADVEAIRMEVGTVTHKALGARYGVSRKLIGHIANGRVWKQVTGHWNPRPGESPAEALKRFGDGHGLSVQWSGAIEADLGQTNVRVSFASDGLLTLVLSQHGDDIFLTVRSLAQLHTFVTALKGLD